DRRARGVLRLNPPLRVVHVDTGRVWRGGQRQALLLAQALRERGHECLCAFRANAPLARAAAAAGLEVLPFAPRGEWDLAAAWGLRRALRRRPPNLLHAHDAHAVGLALAAAWPRVPVVASRRVDFRARRDPGSRLKRAAVRRWLAVSRAAGASLARAGVPREHILLVPSGVAPGAAAQPAAGRPLAGRLRVPADAFLVLAAGRLEPAKGQRTFIEACALVEDLGAVRWVVAGEGPDAPFLRRLAQDLGVAERVVLAGQIPDLPRHMGEVQVLVLPSFAEGLGGAALDALGAGVPIVATRVGGISEMVRHERDGLLVPAGDARSVAGAVRRLYLDGDLRRELGASARCRAEAFTLEATVDTTLAAYRAALGHPNAEVLRPASFARQPG
ncbi:MAG: glycosyltransferase, partial [Gemmatimonadota bacterium]